MRQLYTIAALLITSISFGQNFSRCDIYQYRGIYSDKNPLNSTILYNLQGQMASQVYNDCEGIVFCENYYFYKDSFLIKRISVDKYKDTTQTIYTYNEKGQIVRSESSELKRRLKKGVDKGYGRPGGCLITEDDYEEKKTWMKSNSIDYEYDEQGNKILEIEWNWNRRMKYTWTYDDKNKIIAHYSYIVDKGHSEVLWSTSTYEYSDTGYKYTRTNYDSAGNPKHLKVNAWEYSPQITYTYKVNSKGNITEEIITDEKGKTYSRKTTEYNEFDLISKRLTFGETNNLLETSLYKYTN